MSTESGPSNRVSRRGLRTVGNVAIAGILAMSLAACSSGASDDPTGATSQPTVSARPSPSSSIEATATVGPGTGTGFFGGSVPEVPVRFTMPAGWESDGVFVNRSGADPIFGLAFFDVDNIYADGCKWLLVDPLVGPTVDDLVTAYMSVPELGATPARDVTVDGFNGMQVQITIPDYNEDKCVDGKFGIFQVGGSPSNGPSLWAQAPKEQNKLWILDVDGTRLVILAGYSAYTTAQDRADLEGMVSTIQIG